MRWPLTSNAIESCRGILRFAKPSRTLVALACLLCTSLAAQLRADPSVPADFSLSQFAGGLDAPVDIDWTADGQLLFVAEKGGRVRVIEAGTLEPTPFVNLSAEVNRASDRGLLGMALHPSFPAVPYIYLLYVYDPPETLGYTGPAGPDGNGQRVSRLVRLTADSTTGFRTAIAGSKLVLAGSASTWANIGDPFANQIDLAAAWSCGPTGTFVTDCIPADGLSHSVGAVVFGPDGMLYFGTGDAATWTTVDPRALRALEADSLAGKILRIDPDTGAGLPNNVFWDGNAVSNRSKVLHLGLRNPFRFVFDPASEKLWLGDVGWDSWEELNQSAPGADFGWPCFEGGNGALLQTGGYASTAYCQSYYTTGSAVPAAWAFQHDPQLGGALLAGAIPTESGWPADYQGRLFVSDYAAATLSHVAIDGGDADPQAFGMDLVAVDQAFGPDGALYTVDVTTGAVNRIAFVGSNTFASAAIAVSRGKDDAEERASGNVTVNSSQLELTYATSNQLVGIRFDGVDIPNGAYVVDAYVQFTSAGVDSESTSLVIESQANDDAAGFSTGNSNISSRPRSPTSRQWLPPPWSDSDLSGLDQRTPNLSALVNDVVSRPGWAAGNALVFIISGTGKRVAHSYNGSSAQAPVLHLVWSDGPNTPPQVSITTPADGATVMTGSPVDFTGLATDLEDDDTGLTAGLSWDSDIDGPIGIGGSFQASSLSTGLHAITASVTDSGGEVGAATIFLTVSTNTAPVAQIDAPDPATRFAVGALVAYSGTGVDPEEGTLSGASLTWSGSVIHNTHEHPDFMSATGSSGDFVYPDHDDNAFIRICLTASDSAAASDTDCMGLLPLEILYTFDSVPSGLYTAYNGLLRATPYSAYVTVGGTRQITAPGPQSGYYFVGWNIGGNQTQQVVIGPDSQTVVALFDAAPVVTITAPAEGTFAGAGDVVSFSAYATDVEDDDATLSAQLAWTSDLDGQIGSGASFGIDALSSGTHLVTASVTDSAGLTGQDQVALTIGAVPDWIAVANYQADFAANTPAAGWSYRWNRDAAIGNRAGYVELFWNGAAYDSDGNPGSPDATELRYGKLTGTGGHSGQGINQGAPADRYVIAAWSPTNSASYRVTQSTLSTTGCQWSNGLDLRIYVNDALIHQVSVPPGTSGLGFDTETGALAAGDEVFVAVGPADKDGCDNFAWDFSIEQATGGEPPNSPPVVTNPGDQADSTGQAVSLQIVATDADNDSLIYSISGAPPGLSIDVATGLVSGTPTASGNFATSVEVSDAESVSSVAFTWIITVPGQTWSQQAAFAEDFAVPVPPGWRYQWNANAPIGMSAGYADLAWNGSAWDSDGVAGLPDSSDLAYGRLHGSGGHAGRGVSQGVAADRYVIAGFAVAATGTYRLSQTRVAHFGCQWTNGIDLRVYVNDALQTQFVVAGGAAPVDFDMPLGTLAAGDTLYVAAGPSTKDGCDAFDWDFVIEKAE